MRAMCRTILVSALAMQAVADVNASNTITANRIEWNRLGGMRIHQGRHYASTPTTSTGAGRQGFR